MMSGTRSHNRPLSVPEGSRSTRAYPGRLLRDEKLNNLKALTQQEEAHMQPTRFVDGKPMIIAGLAERFSPETMKGIPDLWKRFGPHITSTPGLVGHSTYGVMPKLMSGSGNYLYLAGVEVSDSKKLPADFTVIKVPARRYAVFAYDGHV